VPIQNAKFFANAILGAIKYNAVVAAPACVSNVHRKKWFLMPRLTSAIDISVICMGDIFDEDSFV